jgi:hypothetical protein
MSEKFKTPRNDDVREQDIVFSQSVKAGKRIYYLDVKRSKRDDLFITITESKKVVNNFNPSAPVTYQKHKIFLYREDFEKFLESLQTVVDFVKTEQPTPLYEYQKKEDNLQNDSEFKLPEFSIDEFE